LSAFELAHVDLQNELKYLTLLWSAKETLYKISDNHLVEFDEDMEVAPLTLSSCGQLYITDKKVEKRYELSYQFFDDFVIVYGAE
jgi:4'-phosphopantetheinyl transferase EntD